MSDDVDKLVQVSRPYVQRLSANIDAIKDTCDMLKEVTDNMDWHISFRSTTCLTLIYELLGVEASCEDFLKFLDNMSKKQLSEFEGDDNNV